MGRGAAWDATAGDSLTSSAFRRKQNCRGSRACCRSLHRVKRARLILAAACVAGCGSGDAPLAGGTDTAVSVPVPVGEELTYGQVTIGNESERSLIIERITVEADEGLDVLGVQLASEDRRENIGLLSGYPPKSLKGSLSAAEGAVIEPIRKGDAGIELIVGVRPNRAGRWWLREITIHYRQGEEHFKKQMTQEVLICSPASSACDLPS